MSEQLTREQVTEIIKCRENFKYFSENYLQITHPKKGLVPFVLYDFQDRVIQEFEDNKYCIVKKFRQAGLTTITCMWMLWKCIFFNDQRILIASKTDREACAVGKCLAIDCKVLTPTGFVNMGDLKVGDFVIGQNGLPTKVTGVFPQGKKQTYKVIFSDNTSTRCCKEHLWNVRTKNTAFKTVELQSLFGTNKKWHIPIVEPVHNEYSSVEDRLKLIRKLMGTNGSINKYGHAQFHSVSKKTINNFCELARSLGCVAKIHKNHVTFVANFNPFNNKDYKPKKPTKTITSIEPNKIEECVCISVANEDGLYVTDDYIVTHNTVQNSINALPAWLIPSMGNKNDHEKEFSDTRSVMWFYTPSAARSRALTYMIIDEAAFVQGMDDNWKSMYPTLSTGGNAIIISTVNGIGGVGGWYHDQYQKAIDRKSQFHVVHIEWNEHPDYNNKEWEQRTRANIGDIGFAQEYEGSFLGSGDTFIPSEVIRSYEKTCLNPVKKMLGEWDVLPEMDFDKDELPNASYEPGAMWIWDMPKVGKEYLIAADGAAGVGKTGDNSAFTVFDTSTLTQVAEFYSKTIPAFKFSQVLAQVGKMYNGALMVVENSLGPGMALVERLEHDLAYENLYFCVTKAGQDRPGLNMNKNIRPVCMESIQTCMLSRLVKIKSIRIIRELLTFIYNPSRQRAESQKGKHDDLIICMGMTLYVTNALNRNVPIGSVPTEDLITKSLTASDDVQKLWKELETGFGVADLLDTEEDIDLLPKILVGDLLARRPGNKILREFNWSFVPMIIYLASNIFLS